MVQFFDNFLQPLQLPVSDEKETSKPALAAERESVNNE